MASNRLSTSDLTAQYAGQGWTLCAIPLGKKGPNKKGWNDRANGITSPAEAAKLTENVGLLHAYSGTMALDVDNDAKAHEWLLARGVDLSQLAEAPDHVGIMSDREGRGKQLFRLPDGVVPIETVQISDGEGVFLEFRCADRGGKSVQDVLPPSIHPITGQPYRWGGLGDWRNLPVIPATLLKVWRDELKGRRRLPAQPVEGRGHLSPLAKSLDDARHPPLKGAEVSAMLATLDPDCSYDQWRNIVWSVAGCTSSIPHDEAYRLAREWSEIGEKWDECSFERVWADYDSCRGIGPGTLIHKAREAGYTAPTGATATLPARPSNARYILRSAGEIMAQPPPVWLVDGILPETGVGAIFGPSGTGKSFVAIDIGLHVSLGKPWFGREVEQRPVIYVSLEGEAGLGKRLRAWERTYGTIPDSFRCITDTFQFAVDVGALTEALPHGAITIIDTLARAAGGLDENSGEGMGTVIAGASAIAKATDGFVLLIHHTGKDSSKGERGHSSLRAALDMSIEVKRDAATRVCTWSLAKSKDGADGQTAPFRLEGVTVGTDTKGSPITSCVVQRDRSTLFAPRQPSGKASQNALSVIRVAMGGGTRIAYLDAVTEVAAGVGGEDVKRRRDKARRHIGTLHNEGFLVTEGAGATRMLMLRGVPSGNDS